MTRAVFFDVDFTLIYPGPAFQGSGYARFCARHGVTVQPDEFNRAVGDNGDVGVYHETYQVKAGQYEVVYGNMPVFGLAAASAHVPVAKRGATAAERIGRA